MKTLRNSLTRERDVRPKKFKFHVNILLIIWGTKIVHLSSFDVSINQVSETYYLLTPSTDPIEYLSAVFRTGHNS